MWGKAVARVASDLLGITSRVDRLESAPIATPSLDAVKQTLKELAQVAAANQTDIAASATTLQNLQILMKNLTAAVSEGIERTDRAERRIKATVKRARAELEARGYQDPGLDAEAYELRLIDGEPSPDGGVPPMQPGVAGPAVHASSIRGVSVETLQRVRGR